MQTPYDALLRLRQREMDDMRVAIHVQIDQLISIENRGTVINNAVAKAAEAAADEVLLDTQAYMARMRAERDAVAKDKAMVDARLAMLQENAVEAYGSLRAAHSAADDFRAETARGIAHADQIFIDDLTAARGHRKLPRGH